MRILIVEDEPDLLRSLTQALQEEGYAVDGAADGEAGLFNAQNYDYDAVVLDVMLPKVDGWEILRRLRKTKKTPVLMLTARDQPKDRVRGLDTGADDYVVKPFSPREVVARVKALLRRANPASEPASPGNYDRGRLRIDFGTYEVFVDGQPKDLALREFELLRFFVQHPMRVYSREQLLDLVWGRDTFVEPRTVDVHVRRLRQQVERDDAKPELILTVRSVGYRFNPEALG